MLTEEYATNLTFLISPVYLGRYLRPGSKDIMQESISLLRSQRNSQGWNFTIFKERPLAFKENTKHLQADISCIISGEGEEIKEVRTLLRIWSNDVALCYRTNMDGEPVKTRLHEHGRRVMVRFHFDRRALSVARPEPIYHMQVGGNASPEEICWFPKQLDVPRFHYPPMDVVLLGELVLVNLFHKESRDLREKPEWKSLIIKSQQVFQKPYFQEFHSHFNSTDDTILGYLVSC